MNKAQRDKLSFLDKIESGHIATSYVSSNNPLAYILAKSLRGSRIDYIYNIEPIICTLQLEWEC